jgi:hypothetical protein
MSQEKISFPSIKNVPESQWEELSKKRIYFGHQSVGVNIVDGIKDVLRENPQIKLRVVETSSPSESEGRRVASRLDLPDNPFSVKL